MKKQLFVLLPSFENYGGHEIEFLKPLKIFANKKKFNLIYLLPKVNFIKLKEKNFRIFFGKKKNYFITKLIFTIFNFLQIYKIFSKNLKSKNIIYIDGFSFYFLISFSFYYFLFLKTKEVKLILWLRYSYESSLKDLYLKFFITKICNLKSTVFLTENNKLKKNLRKNFKNIKLYTMPSLHNLYKYKKKTIRPDAKKNPIILCPGSYRYEKYGVNLINFLNNNFQYKFQLRISKHSRNKIPEINKEKNYKINYIDENLDQKSHIKEIASSDIILLPYKMPDYEYRTSGIFFEAISMNKITLITHGTLITKDLQKFNLEKFSIKNWQNLGMKEILNLLTNKNIHKKLFRLSSYYNKINGIKPFSNKLISIYNLL